MGILKATLKEFVSDDCPRMAAALSYYTMFSLPGLLILVMLMAGLFADPEDLRGRILEQIQVLIGTAGAEQIHAILEHADKPGAGNPLVVIGSLAVLLFAATGAFAQLQGALNRTWEVEPDPERGGMIRNFFMKRVLSFLMILGVALLLLASLVAQTVLTAFGDFVQWLLPDPFSSVTLRVVSVVLSLVMASLLFAALFQILPDARVRWRDAWKGAAATGLLFIVGNVLLGFYLSRSDPASAFGAAGSLALILIWIYYSSMIFFLGAELTQVLARRRGESIRPSRGAVRVVTERKTIRELRNEGTMAGDG